MNQFDLLIRDCQLLLPDLSVLAGATVGVRDSRIVLIDTEPLAPGSFEAQELIDGAGKVALPGFVDAHTHAAQQLLRGSVVDEMPMVWSRILVPFETQLTPEEVYLGAKLFCLENLKAGTTTFADAGGPHMEAVARAAVETGIRGTITRSTMDAGDFVPAAMKETPQEAVRRNEELYEAWHGQGDDRIHIWFGIRQAMTSTPALLEAVAGRSQELKTGVHIHLAEHIAEVAHCLTHYKMRPAEWFDSFGLLGPNVIAGHSVRLSDAEVILMSERGTNAVHCPHANLGNHGFSKTPLMMALGVNIGLGSDGAAASRFNMFEPMRLLKFSVQARHGLEIHDPLALPILETYKMATQGGARAVGRQHEIGTLELDKKADILLLELDKPHLAPTAHLPKTLCMSAGPGDITHVIVNGEVLIKNGECVQLDEEEIRREAGAALLRVGRRANLELGAPYLS